MMINVVWNQFVSYNKQHYHYCQLLRIVTLMMVSPWRSVDFCLGMGQMAYLIVIVTRHIYNSHLTTRTRPYGVPNCVFLKFLQCL